MTTSQRINTGAAGVSGRAPSSPDRIDWRQVRLVLGLRWTIFFRDARRRPVRFALGTVVLLGLLGAVAVGSVVAGFGVRHLVQRGDLELADTAVHLAYLFGFVWLALGPLLAFGANEFLDVTKLFVLPVGHRTVLAATLVGKFTSPAVLIVALPVAAVSLGRAGWGWGALPSLAAGGLVILCAAAAGQWVMLILLNTLRSRIWRDVMMVLGPLVGAGIFIAVRVGMGSGVSGFQEMLVQAARWKNSLLFLPSWWGASAASGGTWVGWLPALALPVLTVWFVRQSATLQEKAFFGEVAIGPGTGVPKGRGRGRGRFAWLPDPLAALVEKDVRLLFREPVVRMVLIQGGAWALVPLGLTMWNAMGRGTQDPGESARLLRALPFVSVVGLMALVAEFSLLANLLGLEGGGLAHTLMTPVRRSRILLAKDVAHLSVLGGLNALLAAAAVAVAYGWAGQGWQAVWRAPLAALEALCYAALAVALGNVVSVFVPVPLAAQDRRALRQRGGAKGGCLAAVGQSGAMIAIGFASVPVFLLFHHADLLAAVRSPHGSAPWLAASVPLAVVLAVGAVVAGAGIGGRVLESREEWLVARMTRSEE